MSLSILLNVTVAIFKVTVTVKVPALGRKMIAVFVFWVAKPFTNCGVVAHPLEPECCVKSLVCCLQAQGYDESLNPQ